MDRLAIRMLGFTRVSIALLRLSLVVVLVWIGGLKFAKYEADSIVPFVANSPFLHVLYRYPAPQYRRYINREGELIPNHRDWHQGNRTYGVSYGLGIMIVLLGILIASHPVSPRLAMVGSLLIIPFSLTTLSFLITTPEVWVPALGDDVHGFPFLSGAGRLIIKDCIMLGASLVTAADSAQSYLGRGRTLLQSDDREPNLRPL